MAQQGLRTDAGACIGGWVRGTTNARALIDVATDIARRAGAPALEAYPIDTEVQGHTANLFPGIASVFARHGFDTVARRRNDRPIVRKILRGASN